MKSRFSQVLLLSSFFALGGAACSGDTEELNKDGGANTCTTNANCPSDQHCENGFCVPGAPPQCSMDDECGPGRRCNNMTCEALTCSTSADCGGWVCSNGVCTMPPNCTDDTMCPDDFTCGANGVCTYTPVMTCLMDEDCTAANTVCIEGECVPAVDCQDTTDCPQGQHCIQDVCRGPCMQNSDCGSAIYACDEMTGECVQRCNNDSVCPARTICEDFLCVEAQCTMDSDCTGMMIECVGEENMHGRCEEIFLCNGPNGCPTGTACNMMTNRCEALPECVGDRDCENDSYCDGGFCQPSMSCTMASCGVGFDCVGGICVPELCRGDVDCTVMGERCIAGNCEVPPAPTFVTQVRIITPAGFVRPGTTYRFVAVALDQAGNAVPGVTFIWTSSLEGVATIDANGLATGEMMAGTTVITAAVDTGSTTITSPGVNLVNLGPVGMDQVRVTIVGAANGSPVNGAGVELEGSFGSLSATTDATGIALFDNVPASAVFSVTAGGTNYDFVSVLGVDSRDLLVPLPPVHKPSSTGGVKGTVDFANVTSEGQVSLSLNGASIASPLVAFDPAGLFGGDIFTLHVMNPQGGEIDIPVPAGSTLLVDFLGNLIPLKDTFYAKADTGIHSTWSFSGRLGLNVLMGAGAGGNLIGAILPYLQRFTHGVRPVVDVVSLPTVVDTGDIDGDGDSMELVPNYAQFPSVALTPDVDQSLRYSIAVDNLPVVSGGNANTLIVVGGMLLPSIGFVPLGLDGLQDMAGNGIVDPFITKIAPPHGGLEVGDYAVLATAVRLEAGALPGPGSARLLVDSRLPEDVDLSDGWMDSPTDATWDDAMREIALPVIANADIYRVSFAHEDGTWNIYTPAPMPAAGSVTIPLAPMGLIDRTGTGTITVDAIDLQTGATVSTVFEVSGGGTVALDRATRGFARASIGP